MNFSQREAIVPFSFDVLVVSRDRSFTFQLERKAAKSNLTLQVWRGFEKPTREDLKDYDAVVLDCETCADITGDVLADETRITKILVGEQQHVEDVELGVPVILKSEPPRKILSHILESVSTPVPYAAQLRQKTTTTGGGQRHAS